MKKINIIKIVFFVMLIEITPSAHHQNHGMHNSRRLHSGHEFSKTMRGGNQGSAIPMPSNFISQQASLGSISNNSAIQQIPQGQPIQFIGQPKFGLDINGLKQKILKIKDARISWYKFIVNLLKKYFPSLLNLQPNINYKVSFEEYYNNILAINDPMTLNIIIECLNQQDVDFKAIETILVSALNSNVVSHVDTNYDKYFQDSIMYIYTLGISL